MISDVEAPPPSGSLQVIRSRPQLRKASLRDAFSFYNYYEVNNTAVAVLGDAVLRDIARELVDTVKKNISIDWTVRENVQAKMRIAVKKILRKHGYPPDMEAKATETVIEQAKLLANELN